MRRRLLSIVGMQQFGLVVIIVALGVIMSLFAGTHLDRVSGQTVNNFLNPSTLIQIATDTSFFAIMAVGMTMVIISAGIDLSIGSVYAMSAVLMSLALQKMTNAAPVEQVLVGMALSCGIGLLAGLFNGVMVSRLGVHPFIITLGTMWVFRGIAFVTTKAMSILVPESLTHFAKANLGMRRDLFPVPMVVMLVVTVIGALFLQYTTWGRRIFAAGGNIEAAKYSGLNINRILSSVYVIAGLSAGIAAFVGTGFYGASSSGDAQGYELYVIASAVVGGASLNGGKGSAIGAMLGALLIVMIRQAIRTLNLDQNYEWIIIGFAIVISVVLDRWNATRTQRRLVQARQ
ncbi:MAG: ABC transporter permease [Fimbriimonas sp.]|nr:ABC transporter permease [Fimbriimonas sp.]